MLNNSGNGHGTSWPVEGLSYPEAAQGYAPPQTAYDQSAPHIVAQKALAYVAYTNGASYPNEADFLKAVEAGYSLGQRDAKAEADQKLFQTKRLQSSFLQLLDAFWVSLAENGFDPPEKMVFSPEGLGKINESFGYSPTGYQRTKSITTNGTVELESSAQKKSCTCS